MAYAHTFPSISCVFIFNLIPFFWRARRYSSWRRKNKNLKSYSFWIEGIGRDINHLIDESIESEITPAQEAEAMILADSGMNYRDIATRLGVTALSVYYALKKKGKPRQKSR